MSKVTEIILVLVKLDGLGLTEIQRLRIAERMLNPSRVMRQNLIIRGLS